MNMPAKQYALTVLIGVILFLAAGIAPPALQAIEETNPLTVDSPSLLHNECPSVGGWMWTPGPMMPEIAHKVQHILHSEGINAQVMARSFGETDPCGHFRPYEIDFSTCQATNDHKPEEYLSGKNFLTTNVITPSLLPICNRSATPFCYPRHQIPGCKLRVCAIAAVTPHTTHGCDVSR